MHKICSRAATLGSAILAVVLALTLACSSSPPTESDEPPVPDAGEAEQEQQHFESLLNAADQAYAQRTERGSVDDALDAWQQALDSSMADDPHMRVEILVSIARAHHFIARYHSSSPLLDDSDPAYLQHATAGLESAEEAVRIKAPEFYQTLQRGAPFEDDFSPPDDQALEPVLWYAKNLDLLARHGAVSEELESTAIIEFIMEFVLNHNPEAHYGAAHRYFGTRWITRDFHRSPDNSQRHYDQSLEVAPDFLLTRLLRARHLAQFQGDRRAFERDLQIIIDSPADELAENYFTRQWAQQLLAEADRFFDD